MSYSQRIVAFFKYAVRAGSKAVEIGGDLVFATSTPLTIAIPGVKASKKLKVPMVFEVRDLWPELPIAVGALKNPLTKFLAKKLEKFAYKNSSHIVALSPGMAEGVMKAGYPEKNITVIPNSADLDIFIPDATKARSFRTRHPELGDRPIVLYAGTLGIINGVSYFADLAADTLKLNENICFVLIGSGMEWEKVRHRAIELGILNKSFYMYSAIPKTALVDAFAAASISTSLFVDLKPMEANSANKFFDTLASGTPIAINYGGWQVPVLENYDAGIRLSRDVKLAALQISNLLEDNERLANMGLNARRLAEEHFSRDVLATKLENCLNTAVIK
jgi:glycosyltransferase involved in cell wall biosynthesis